MASSDSVRGQVRGATVVTVDGAVITPSWAAGYCPTDGDPVEVFTAAGVAVAVPVGPQRPPVGTVTVAASGGYVQVLGSDSLTYACRYVGTAPTVGNLVALLWQGSQGWVLGVAAATATSVPTLPAPPTAPPSTGSGTLSIAAIDSGSYRSADGWGTTGSRPLSTHAVVQGTAPGSSYAYSGAWFYGAQAGALAGATVTAIRIWLPGRLTIGSYNSALTAHLYSHTNGSKPAGDVTRNNGPSDQSLAAGYSGGWVTLPLGWASTLVAGGGIGTTGPPYLGLKGLDADPASGNLQIDWTR